MVQLSDIRQAAECIYEVARPTALKHSTTLSEKTGYDVYLKPECLQKTGSFKIRGAANKILSLSEHERARGVITASSGNHGQGVACAAKRLGIAATVVMPEGGSSAKAESIRAYGAELLFCGTTSDERLSLARKLCDERNMTFVHPFDDKQVIAGQGTIGLEILQELESVDAVLVPTGGGGLISGIAVAIKEQFPHIKILGVEPVGSNSTELSFKAGVRMRLEKPDSIADGIRTSIPGEKTFPLIQKYVDDTLLVPEESIIPAMKWIMQRCKYVVEPTGAVTVAALMEGVLPASLRGKKIVPILSGGNVALDALAAMIG